MANKPIEIEVKVKKGNKIKSYKLKIFGEIDYSRENELEEIPNTPEGYKDIWLIAKQLCEKDGGRLPNIGELALIAALQEMKLLNTKYSGYFWSSSEVSASAALRRTIYGYCSSWHQYSRGNYCVPLCVGD